MSKNEPKIGRRRLLRFAGHGMVAAAMPALASVFSGEAEAVEREYLGLVTQGGALPTDAAGLGTPISVMSRKLGYVRAQTRSAQVALAIGWYVDRNGQETILEGDYQVRGAIEYPLGVFTRLTFGDRVTGDYCGGDVAISDPAALKLEAGDIFAVRVFLSAPNGWTFVNHGTRLPGDGLEAGASVTDRSMGGIIAENASASFPPMGVIGITSARSFMLIGDSLMGGQGTDSPDSGNDFGLVARGIGPTRAYCNFGRPSTMSAQFTKSAASRRVDFAQYVTDVISSLGRNDLKGDNHAEVLASIAANRSFFSPKRYFQTTIAPTSTGQWSAPDGSDQTPAGAHGGLTADRVNDAIRAGLNLIDGCIDIRKVLEFAPGMNRWKPGLTADGIHPNISGYRLTGSMSPGINQLLTR